MSGLPPALSAELTRLTGQLGEMQRRITSLERGMSAATLGNSSIEADGIVVNDDSGNPVLILGQQADGTYGQLAVNASPPAQPSDPIVTQAVHGLIVSWDGMMADGSPVTADFAGAQVHVSPQPAFVPGPATLQSTLIGPGTRPVAGLSPGVTYYVCLVTLNIAGLTSTPSNYITQVPQEVTDIIPPSSITAGMMAFTVGGVHVTIGPTAPSGPGTGDLWFDATNNYVMNQWDGTAWQVYQFGHNAIAASAITADLIAANAITAGMIAAGAIDGMTINGLTINGVTINASNLLVSGNTGGIFAYSTGGTTTQTFYANTTWIAPPGVTTVNAMALAPGGGGAYGTASTKAGGGDGGEIAQETNLAVTPGNSYAITIGAVGAQGISSSPAGGNGGDVTIPGDTVSVIARGGRGGLTNGSHTTPVHSTNTVHYNGGIGYAPTVNGGPSGHGGGGGSSAGQGGPGNNAPSNGNGAAAPVAGWPGGNGFGGGALNDSGDVGAGYGGGGGAGPSGGHVGAQGSPGWARLTYTPASPTLVASICGATSLDPVLGTSCPSGIEMFGAGQVRFQGIAGEILPGLIAGGTAETLQIQAPHTLASDFVSVLKLVSQPTPGPASIYGNGLELTAMSAQYPGGPIQVSRNSTTTLAADPYLSVNCLANAVYDLEMLIIYNGPNGSGHLKFTLVSPSGTEIEWMVPVYTSTVSATTQIFGETSQTAPTKAAWTAGTANPPWSFQIIGTVYMGSIAGPVQFWWAQNSSSATNTKIWSGSRMTLHHVA
jgi:hypothetical protein